MSYHDEQLRREHVKHEQAVKSFAWLYFLFGLIAVLALISLILDEEEPLIEGGAVDPESLLNLGLVVGLSAMYVLTGLGIRRLRAWARWLGAILILPWLLAFPFGTFIAIYVLYLLLSTKGSVVLSAEYREVIAATPHIKPPSKALAITILLLLLLIYMLPWIARIIQET